MGDLYSEIASFIHSAGLLSGRTRIVVAVSGGADSLCLLDCLTHMGLDPVVAHLDHRLRSDSAADGEYVRQVCDRYHVPFVLGREDVHAQVRRGSSLEETARRVRYRFLGEVCRTRGIDTVAVGHTQDDQVETVLMHFLRGAGPDGLRGMAPVATLGPWLGEKLEGLRLIRPLLGTTREQTRGHCLWVGLEPREDATNVDRRYLRNRVRHELIPILESYNPNFRLSLIRLAKIMTGHREMVAPMVESAWRRIVARPEANALRIDRGSLLAESPAIQRELLRMAHRSLARPNAELGFEGVERLLSWMGSGAHGALGLPGSFVARVDGDTVILEDSSEGTRLTRWPQCGEGALTEARVPSTVSLDHGWRLEICERPAGAPGETEAGIHGDRLEAVFDADMLPTPLRLRTAAPGDRLHPYGMVGSTKLSDLFINLHIPRLARRNWPLLLAEREILWVCGLRRSSHAPVTPSTKRILLAALRPPLGARTFPR